ncbi:MAG: hypothetical protein PWQ37_1430 [Candidatus Petromonas sp.]|jgi:hypothetical protein|nr:hypothetical protein [Candidatus Petromonas sp.]
MNTIRKLGKITNDSVKIAANSLEMAVIDVLKLIKIN